MFKRREDPIEFNIYFFLKIEKFNLIFIIINILLG